MVALGLFGRPTSYFRVKANILDFVVALEGLIDLLSSSSSSTLSGFRLLRILRPLRTLARLQGLRLVMESLGRSFSILCSMFVIALFFLVILSIVGVQVCVHAVGGGGGVGASG